MKRFLSIALTVVMIASLCAVNINAAIDINNFSSVKKYNANTSDSDFAGNANTLYTQQDGYIDLKNDGVDDAWLALKPGADNLNLTAYNYLAIKMKANSMICNGWFYFQTSVAGWAQAGSALFKNHYEQKAAAGNWEILVYAIPADCNGNGGLTLNRDAVLQNLRFGAPANGSGGTISLAWFGLFTTEDEIYEYDAAYSAAYTNVPTNEKPDPNAPVLKEVTTRDLIIDNYDFSKYTLGKDIMDASTSVLPAGFTSADNIRDHWTPEEGQGQRKVTFTAENDGNVYLKLAGNPYFSMTTDYFYHTGTAYTYSIDVKDIGASANNEFRGMLINYGEEENDNNAAYEASADIRNSTYVGDSGLGISILNANTVRVYVLTFGTSLNVVYADFPATFGSDWTTLAVTDNGVDTITVSVGGDDVAYVSYSDIGTTGTTRYQEQYYRTIKISDIDGVVKAETAEGLMSIYKSMAFGTRTVDFSVDNVKVAKPAVNVTGVVGSQTAPSASSIAVPVTLTSANIEVISAHLKFTYPTDLLTYTGYTMGKVFKSWGAGTKITDPIDANGTIEVLIQGGEGTNIEAAAANGDLLYLNFDLATVDTDTAAVITCESPNADDDFCGNFDGTTIPDYDAFITAGVITIAAPFVPAEPTEITLKEGTAYRFHKTYTNVLVAVPTLKTGVTIDMFLAELADTTNIQIVDTKGAVVTTGVVKNGYAVQLTNASGEVIQAYSIAVLADARETGTINALDYRDVKTFVTNKTQNSLSETRFAASDYDNNGLVNALDYRKIKTFYAQLG